MGVDVFWEAYGNIVKMFEENAICDEFDPLGLSKNGLRGDLISTQNTLSFWFSGEGIRATVWKLKLEC